jgi:transposase
MDGPECAGCRERDAIIAELKARIVALGQRLAELEARLKTNSSNSSRPPSANPPWAPKPPPKPPTGRKPGGQPGHAGHARPRLPADEIVPHVASHCERCQSPLPTEAAVDDPPPTWHQVAELPSLLASITEHQGQARTCVNCGHVT